MEERKEEREEDFSKLFMEEETNALEVIDPTDTRLLVLDIRVSRLEKQQAELLKHIESLESAVRKLKGVPK